MTTSTNTAATPRPRPQQVSVLGRWLIMLLQPTLALAVYAWGRQWVGVSNQAVVGTFLLLSVLSMRVALPLLEKIDQSRPFTPGPGTMVDTSTLPLMMTVPLLAISFSAMTKILHPLGPSTITFRVALVVVVVELVLAGALTASWVRTSRQMLHQHHA